MGFYILRHISKFLIYWIIEFMVTRLISEIFGISFITFSIYLINKLPFPGFNDKNKS